MPLLFLVDRVGISGFSYLFIYLFLPEKKNTHTHIYAYRHSIYYKNVIQRLKSISDLFLTKEGNRIKLMTLESLMQRRSTSGEG